MQGAMNNDLLEMLNRPLNDNQVNLLAVDIVVGDIPAQVYLSIAYGHYPGVIKQSALMVLDRAFTIIYGK